MTTYEEPEWMAQVRAEALTTLGDFDAPAPTNGNGTQSAADPRVARELDAMRARVLAGADILTVKPPEPLIGGVLERDSLASLYGPTGAGKSFVLLDWSLTIGTPDAPSWFGHPTRHGPVLYVVAESLSSFQPRYRAWAQHRGPAGCPAGELLHWYPQAVNLLDPHAATALAMFAAELGPLELVIIDTLNRSMPGGNENAPQDMGLIIDAADKVRLATGTCVLFAHHTGKDETLGSRGHSSFKGAIDTEIRCTRAGHVVTLKAEKCKNGPDGHIIETLAMLDRGGSIVLDVYDFSELDRADRSDSRRAATLRVLAEIATPDGIGRTAWRDAVVKETGVDPATFYRHLKRLLDDGDVVNLVPSDSKAHPRYVPAQPHRKTGCDDDCDDGFAP